MTGQIFISHSRHDEKLLEELDRVFGPAGVGQYRANITNQSPPVSEDLKEEIRQSIGVFVLLGPEAEARAHTKSWIAWEAGVAAQLEQPIWILEDVKSTVKMPIPSFTDYVLWDSTEESKRKKLRDILKSEFINEGDDPVVELTGLVEHPDGARGPQVHHHAELSMNPRMTSCPYRNCGEEFKIWFEEPATFNCPSCRRILRVP